jgi:hypothetical protein
LRDSCDIASSLWLEASRRLQESYYFASSLLRESSDLAAVACEQDSNSTSTDLFASIIWKDGPFGNGTDLFASSLLQTASASRRLRDSYEIASSLWLDASRRLQESYYVPSSLLRESSDLAAVACEQDSNSTSTDLFASILWKDGPFGNGTDLFASSLLQSASASRRLRDVMDDIKPLTQYSVDNALA